MSGKTSPTAQSGAIRADIFYGESPPKKSRLQETTTTTKTSTYTTTNEPTATAKAKATITTSTTTFKTTTNALQPAFKSFKDNLIEFDRKLAEPVKSIELKLTDEQEAGEDQAKTNLDRDSPIPLKNLGNTCYENSIIQCLFSLNMFMDNFEQSIENARRFVVKSISTTPSDPSTTTEREAPSPLETANSSTTSNTTTAATTNITSTSTTTTTITPTNEPTTLITTAGSTTPSSSISSLASTCATTIVEDDVRYRISNAFDKLYKSYTQKRIQSVTNLTPIALLSSAATPSEQSEIETRLEDLKSAVGERSSQFNSTHQQDASEFFYHVIDSIQEFYQSLGKSRDDDNPVTKAFELELDYVIRCPKCHHRTLMSEPEKIRTLPLALPHVNNELPGNQEEFNHDTNGAPTPPTSDLGSDSPKSSTSDEQRNGLNEKENLALVDHNAPEDYSNNTKSIAKLDLTDKPENTPVAQKQYTLCDALNNYFKDDLLEYNCSQSGCDSKHRTKKCLIRKLPQVLFITLARYSYTGKKNLDEIEAPFELSVPFQENKSPSHSPSAHRDFNNDNDNTYQLVAVVCHLGSSLNAGHYTSYVYNQNNFSWYSCDDDSITKVPESEVKTDARKSGYCFFYAHTSCINKSARPQDQVQLVSAPKTHSEEADDEVQVIEPPHLVTSNLGFASRGRMAPSSAIMTPDPSPKSSPSPTIPSNQDTTNLHDDHSVCTNGTIDMTLDDDWS